MTLHNEVYNAKGDQIAVFVPQSDDEGGGFETWRYDAWLNDPRTLRIETVDENGTTRLIGHGTTEAVPA